MILHFYDLLDLRNHTDSIDIFLFGMLGLHILLRHQKNVIVVIHRRFHGMNGSLGADIKMRHHTREQYGPTQDHRR